MDAAVSRKSEKLYSVGIYARLSVDNKDTESIEAQTEIVKAFIKKQGNMKIFDCYTDIGKTGTSFQREGFERMMQDVRRRKVNCIIVKDLSRFGRNHIETGNYIEKIFPFMGVRFIAVTDNFDSMDVSGQDEMLGVDLKNLVNEMYAKDVSIKVKSSRKAKWEEGGYTGGIAPYGYRAKWMNGKKCLFVEETTSDIVRNIFYLFLSGKNMKEIIVWLYEKGVTRPMEYHKTGLIYCQDINNLQQWSKGTVKRILTNPVYMGCLVRGRAGVEPVNWIIKENTHEEIIKKDEFFKAAERFREASSYYNRSRYSKRNPLEEDIFTGVLYCGDCGSKMKRITAVKELSSKKEIRVYSYNCPNASRIDTDKCVSKSIALSLLNHIVKEAVRQELLLSGIGYEKLIEACNQEAESRKKEEKRRQLFIGRRIENIRRLGSEQYFKYRMGETDENGFQRVREENNKRIAFYQKKQVHILEKLKEIDDEAAKGKGFLQDLTEGGGKCDLTAEAIRALIDRIEVYQDHRVKVIFSFKRKIDLTERAI